MIILLQKNKLAILNNDTAEYYHLFFVVPFYPTMTLKTKMPTSKKIHIIIKLITTFNKFSPRVGHLGIGHFFSEFEEIRTHIYK